LFSKTPVTEEKEKILYAFRFFGIILSYKFQSITFRFSQGFSIRQWHFYDMNSAYFEYGVRI